MFLEGFYLGGVAVATITAVGAAVHTRTRPGIATAIIIVLSVVTWPVSLPSFLAHEIWSKL